MLGNSRTCRPRVRVSALALAIFSVISIGAVISAKADEDDLKKGTFIPTGVQITPSAASGSSFQALNPGLSFDSELYRRAGGDHRNQSERNHAAHSYERLQQPEFHVGAEQRQYQSR